MESSHTKDIDFSFLLNDDSEAVFSKLDYLLKDGVHLQKFGSQVGFFEYLEKYSKELRNYYQILFGVTLEWKGEGLGKYYYLDYHSKERSKLPEAHKTTFKNDVLIIGFIIYKVIFFDGNIELNSIALLKKKITLDYEEYEEGLLRLIAKSTDGGGKLSEDDVQIDKVVDRTLSQFKKIGWVELKGDYLETLPSIHRLLYVYEDVIRDMKNIITKYK
ncbi:MAG: hypothetical protein ABNH00_11785 [Dokdonia sp.]|jgi:hypothetical protein